VAVQPLQDDDEADEATVSPLLPLLVKLQADIRRSTFLLLHEGHFDGASVPRTRYSKALLHLTHLYS